MFCCRTFFRFAVATAAARRVACVYSKASHRHGTGYSIRFVRGWFELIRYGLCSWSNHFSGFQACAPTLIILPFSVVLGRCFGDSLVLSKLSAADATFEGGSPFPSVLGGQRGIDGKKAPKHVILLLTPPPLVYTTAVSCGGTFHTYIHTCASYQHLTCQNCMARKTRSLMGLDYGTWRKLLALYLFLPEPEPSRPISVCTMFQATVRKIGLTTQVWRVNLAALQRCQCGSIRRTSSTRLFPARPLITVSSTRTVLTQVASGEEQS